MPSRSTSSTIASVAAATSSIASSVACARSSAARSRRTSLRRRRRGRAAEEQEERERQREAAAGHEHGQDRGGRDTRHLELPGPAARRGGAGCGRFAGARGENCRAVGHRDVGAVGGLVDERLGRERGHDDAAERVAALAGRSHGEVLGEDGSEGEDAEATVAFEPHRSGEPRLRERARLGQRAARATGWRRGRRRRGCRGRGQRRSSGYVKSASCGAPIRIFSVASSRFRSAAGNRGAQPSATISGRAKATSACAETTVGPSASAL